MPIIVNIFRSESTAGMNEVSHLMETSVFIASGAQSYIKGHAFSTWGEHIIIVLQNIFILGLMAFYNKSHVLKTFAVFAGFFFFIAMILQIPSQYADFLVYYSMVFSIGSKLPQIMTNASNGHTGVQSPITVSLQLIGAAVRLVTILVETKDMIVVAAYVLSLCLNGTILSQILIYRQATVKAMQEIEKKKKA